MATERSGGRTARPTQVPALVPTAAIDYPRRMDRVPNRGRIARAAEEARILEVEKPAQETTKSRSKSAVKAVRVKVVWEVCSGTGKILKTYPYPDKAAAEAQTKALTRSTGRAHTVRAAKVPME